MRSTHGSADRPARAERVLPGVATSVPAARRFVVDTVGSLLGDPSGDVMERLKLLISELATNCVIHAGTEFRVAVAVSAHEIRVEVTDFGAGRPEIASPSPTEPHGRGLRFVDQLATAWGSESPSDATEKTTWFEVALADPRGLQVSDTA